MNGLRLWWTRRLWRRIAVISVGLLLAVQAVVLGLVYSKVPSLVEALGAQDLHRGEEIWQELVSARARVRERQVEQQADDSGLIDALLSGDDETLRSAIDNAGGRVDARVTALLAADRSLRVLGETSSRGDIQRLQPAIDSLVQGLRAKPGAPARRAASLITLVDGQPGLLVVAQMKAAAGANLLVMGVPFTDDLPATMQKSSLLQVAMLVRRPGQAERVALSSLPEADHAALLALAPAAQRIVLPGGAHLIRRVAAVDTAGGHFETVLLHSVSQVEKPFDELMKPLLLASFGGVLLALLGSWYAARRVTTPLNALAEATKRLGAGNLDEHVPLPRYRDEVGQLARAVDDMRQNIRGKQAEIRDLAYIDSLTRLPNRVSFGASLRHAITQVGDGHSGDAPMRFAVVMLGLDRFKVINDLLGYALGDEVLREVADRLRQHVQREGDLIVRLSGDQFALLLQDADARRAIAVVDGIALAFVHPLVVRNQTLDISTSAGIACWPGHALEPEPGSDGNPGALRTPGAGEQAEALMSRAEVAMYGAKKGKATHAMVYEPKIDASSRQTLTLLSELRQAIGANELRLFLQPKIDVARHAVIGAEALVRWQHPTRGMVPPMDFIPFAEDTGFVRKLTLWIFEETARQWAGLHAAGLQRVSVNLSTRDLLDPELPTRFDAILRRQGVPATAFCLEITESAIMTEPKRALAMLDTLARAGFKLSIDDYGEGQTSLSYLKRLPVHELKIDQIFIKQIDRDEKDAKIVRSTIGLAHSLGFRVVAEGVENAAIMVLLRELGCDEAQGYHLGRPMPAAELPAFARQWAEKAGAAAAAATVTA
ncbi:MAG: EAL domain-containing protein [Rubrivivax sp.]|nr:EAL domain-containing protein [Rubrivivax sp.]